MASSELWRLDTDQCKPPLVSGEVYRPDVLAVIERTIDDLRPALRTLSDKIHGASSTRPLSACCQRLTIVHAVITPARPELSFEEQCVRVLLMMLRLLTR